MKNLVTRVDGEELRSFSHDYWYLVRAYRPLLWSAVFWIFCMQIVALAEPYSFKYIIDLVQGGGISSIRELVSILFVLFVVFSFGGVVQAFKSWRIYLAIFPISRDLPGRAAKKLFSLPLSYHEREAGGELLSKVIKGISRTEDVTASLLFEVVSLGLQTLIAACIIGYYARAPLLVFVIVVVLFAYATYRFKQKMMPVRCRRHEEDGEADSLFGQAIENISTVQAFAQESYERERIEVMHQNIYVGKLKEFWSYVRFDFLKNELVSFGRVCVVGLCVWAAISGKTGIGTLVFIGALAGKVFVDCYRMGNIFDRIQEASVSVRRLVEVLKTEDQLVDPPNPVPASTLDGSISIRGVTHVYGGKLPRDSSRPTRPALIDVNLEIANGEFIGIVGPSGGGKSTLVKLLHRTDDPTEGSIRIGGIDLKMLARADFRSRIGNVPQHVEIFNGTIAENIAYGKRDATREEIIRAAKIANAHDFIMAKGGYDQQVGNKGMKLSGGQKQRLGIARAILLDPLVLIFDEATSQNDSLSEAHIMKAIEAVCNDRTTIMIAHRLSTVRNAHRIVVIEEGRIVQIGTHDELMANEGLYRRLIDLQRMEEEAS